MWNSIKQGFGTVVGIFAGFIVIGEVAKYFNQNSKPKENEDTVDFRPEGTDVE